MVDISKAVRVLSWGFVLWVGLLCNMAQADTMVPKADVEKEGNTYFIKELGGEELSFRTDATTTKAEKIQVGDRIEAKVDENNRALSLVLAP